MKKKNTGHWKGLVAACLALVLLGGGGWLYSSNYAVASVVSLDVNPSIEMTVSRNERVLSCVALNEDGAKLLSDLGDGGDLKGIKLNVAFNAVVGALVKQGYLEKVSSAILISVEDKNTQRASRLQQELTAWTDRALQEGAAQGAVLSQTVSYDQELQELSQSYQISTGKAALVQQVMALNGNLKAKELSALTVEELKDLAETGAQSMPIGLEQAAKLAMSHAGVESSLWEVDAELDERPAHYEVEFLVRGQEYECRINAFTGEILELISWPEREDPSTVPGGETISRDKALDLAVADFFARYPELKGSAVLEKEVELDTDDGRRYYEVEFMVGDYMADYVIDAATGAVLGFATSYPGLPAQGQDPSGDIGRDAALSAALKHAGLKQEQVSKIRVELDRDDGRAEYEVEFSSGGMEYEYSIDAASGAVLEHEKDRDG